MDILGVSARSISSQTRDTSLDKTLRKLRTAQYPQYAVYLVACFIFLVALINAVSLLCTHHALRFPGSRVSSTTDNESGRRPSERHRHASSRRIPQALINAARVIACRLSFPIAPSVRFTLANIIVCAFYLLMVLCYEFVNTRNTAGMLDPKYWANRAAVLAVSQLALIIALSGKNNVISGTRCRLANWNKLREIKFICLAELTGNDSLHFGWDRSGIVANASLTLMVILGTRQLRNLAYEVFLASHIVLAIIFLVAACIHVTKARQFLPYVWAACIFWAFDRTLRLARVLRIRYLAAKCAGNAGQATLVALSSDTVGMSLRLARSSYPLVRFGWRPGQSAYLSVPAVAKWGLGLSTEAHPFTIASIDSPTASFVRDDDKEGPNEDKEGDLEIKFIMRVREGFTRRLHDHAVLAGGMCSVSAYVDGPYGDPPAVYSYPNVVLVAGGSGVSFTLPLLLDLVRRARKGASHSICQKVKFMWYIREQVHFECLSRDLKAIEESVPNTLQVEIAVFVTGTENNHFALDVPSFSPSSEKHVNAGKQAVSEELSTTASKDRPEIETPKSEFETEVPTVEVIANRIVHLEYGKPAISGLLSDEISTCMDSVAVCVSGPQSLIDDVRGTLSKPSIAGPMTVLRGGPSIFLHVENFGM